jgi:hypothetical protein
MRLIRLDKAYTGLLCGLGLAVFLIVLWHQMLPPMVAAFASMGTPLPWLTSVFVRYYDAMSVVPVVAVFAAWIFWPNREMRGDAALKAGWLATVTEMGLGLVAMYLPIFGVA